MDNRKLKRYVALIEQKQSLEEELTATKEAMAELDEYIMENMLESGTQKITMDGYTVYIQRMLWASGANGQDALNQAIIGEGYAELVEPRVNANRLAALVREYDADPTCLHDEYGLPILPGDLKDAIKISEQFKVRARKTA